MLVTAFCYSHSGEKRKLYDPDNKVYYRIVYVPQETDKDVKPLLLLRSGRKQFLIIIFDKHFNIIGEHLFPSYYTYNPRLCFITKGKLYISTNHVMNPNYSDDVLSFQMERQEFHSSYKKTTKIHVLYTNNSSSFS
ncbi:DUF4221 family protein [Phocaeicola coprocola]|uniref:DUF4221 family protein n=1 Tax=Phocaeicola coprocola TaxID=310298 RepID=UPI00325AE303